jgi:hypothetical protein
MRKLQANHYFCNQFLRMLVRADAVHAYQGPHIASDK